ncbi:Crp/Fnr family transcriptional regulator [Roseivirga sp. BDSF3-8]|uniref:Crp/Fnr family transcriptional regulator n=1 Tax=Roseivirga sp. BDSF3-8 TaxID=3241598 RepID=UPI003532446F
MDELIHFLLEFSNLNTRQLELVRRQVYTKKLRKDEYFSEAGKVSKEIAFVKQGILRLCYYNREGQEITKYFIAENKFAVDLNSFQTGLPSTEYLQAVEDCELLIFSDDSMKHLSETIIGWDEMVNKISSKALIDKMNRLSPMLSEDAKTRYLNFYERFPDLANRVPLNHLASFIGITSQSLSRIRKELKEGEKA